MTTLIEAMNDIDLRIVDAHIKNKYDGEKRSDRDVEEPLSRIKTVLIPLLAALAAISAVYIVFQTVKSDNDSIGSYSAASETLIAPETENDPTVPERTLENAIFGSEDVISDHYGNKVYIEPPEDGTVRLDGEIKTIAEGEAGKNGDYYAVLVSGNSEQYYNRLHEKRMKCINKCDELKNGIEEHSKLTGHVNPFDYELTGCEICKSFSEKVILLSEEKNKLSDMMEKSKNYYLFRTEEYLTETGTTFIKKNVYWGDAAYHTPEPTVYLVALLTADEIKSFTAPDDLGITLALAPEWLASDEVYVVHPEILKNL